MNNLVANRTNGRRFGTLLWEPMRLFDDVAWSTSNQSPLHVTDAADVVTITVDMPGVDPQDLDLTLEKGTLAIAGTRGERIYRYSVALGDSIDPNAIEARLDKGVLEVRAHKRAESKPRKIVVESK